MDEAEIAVIGGGPAGLAAAVAAARAGARVTLIDEGARLGGHFAGARPEHPSLDDASKRADDLVERLGIEPIEVYSEALVWGVFEHRALVFAQHGKSLQLGARKVVLATGGDDRAVAFPGWTLPGVLLAGELQRLLRAGQPLPGRRLLLAGTGPHLLALAVELLAAGVEIVAVVDAATRQLGLGLLPGLVTQRGRLQESQQLRRTLQAARVPLLDGHALVAARGEGHVAQAAVARLERDGSPSDRGEQTFDVDVIGLAFGTAPTLGLAQIFGCDLAFMPRRGVFAVRVDDDQQTSQSGVFAAGDLAGGSDVTSAIAQGRIAGVMAAHQVGRIGAAEARGRLVEARRDLAGASRFADLVAEMFPLPASLVELARDDTVVCPCEGITAGRLRRHVADWGPSLDGIRAGTRCGLGRCQGRVCGPVLQQLAPRYAERPPEDAGVFSAALPARPVPLDALVELEIHSSSQGH